MAIERATEDLVSAIEDLGAKLGQAKASINQRFIGQETVVDLVLPCDRHLFFLHGLQQRRLRPRAGAVDLIRHQKLAKDRPLDKAKRPRTILGRLQHLRPQNIGRHQIGRELDAVAL